MQLNINLLYFQKTHYIVQIIRHGDAMKKTKNFPLPSQTHLGFGPSPLGFRIPLTLEVAGGWGITVGRVIRRGFGFSRTLILGSGERTIGWELVLMRLGRADVETDGFIVIWNSKN